MRVGVVPLAIVLLVTAWSGTVHAQTGSGTSLVDERFDGPSVADPNFGVQGRTCLTGRPIGTTPAPGTANIPACPAVQSGPVPTPGVLPGYLQFTDTNNNRAGSTLYNRPVPSSAGIIATFDQWQYGGNGADGISYFLVDGATNLTDTGGLGGSLGYAQRNAERGVDGAYLGVGFDAFGNFYNDGENRGNGCSKKPPFLPTTNTRVPDVITLRGPGNGLTGYCWLGSTATSTTPPVSNLGASLRANTLAAARRTIQITITPAPSPRVTVSVDFYDGRGPQTVLDIPAPPNPPGTYKFGWSGSTGGQNDVHLIRNVVVKTVVPLNQLNLVKQIDQSNPLPNPLVVGSVVPYQFTLTNTGLETLTDLTVIDPQVTGITCPTTRIDPAPAPTSTVVCRGLHVLTQADLDAGLLVNTATATAIAPGPLQVTSNPSTVTLPLGTTPRLALKKFVDTPSPYAVGQAIAYRYEVTNVGTVTLNNPTVHDDKGFAVTCALPTTLVPGGAFNSSTTCTGTYVIRAADVDPTTGLLTNTATASAQVATGGNVTSNPSSLSIPVGVDIAVTKSVNNATPLLGDVVTFTVTATNQGPGDATGLGLGDPIGAGVAFLSATAPPGTTYDPATGAWTIGNLPSGQSATLQLRVQVVSVDPYTNVASVATLDQPDLDPANDSARAVITPIRDADVAMSKSVDNAAPAVDQQVTFTVTADNFGPSPASGVVVSDPLPGRADLRVGHRLTGGLRRGNGRLDGGRARGQPVRHALHHRARHPARTDHEHDDQDRAERTRSRSRQRHRERRAGGYPDRGPGDQQDRRSDHRARRHPDDLHGRRQQCGPQQRDGRDGRGPHPRPAHQRDLDLYSAGGGRLLRRGERIGRHHDHGRSERRTRRLVPDHRDGRSCGHRHAVQHGDGDAPGRNDGSRSGQQHGHGHHHDRRLGGRRAPQERPADPGGPWHPRGVHDHGDQPGSVGRDGRDRGRSDAARCELRFHERRLQHHVPVPSRHARPGGDAEHHRHV